MISVTRNTHIPRVDDSNCCAASSNWCCKPGESSAACTVTTTASSAKLRLFLLAGIVVGWFGHHRLMLEIERGGRSGGLLPLQSLRSPRILRSLGTPRPRPPKVDHWQQVTH